MQTVRFHGRRYLVVGVVCLLLVSCGKSEEKKDNSVRGRLQRTMKIENLRVRSKKLLEIADTQFGQDDKLSGKATIGLAVNTAQQMEGAYERGAALNSAAYAYGKHGLVDQASEVLKTVYTVAADLEEADLHVSLLAKMGEIQIRFLDRLNTGNDLFQEATTLSADAAVPEQKVRAKMNLAFHLHRLKRMEPRDDLVDQSFAALEDISNQRQRVDVTGDLASRLVQMECQEPADRAFQMAEKGVSAIEEPLNRGYALCEIGERLSKAKRASAAQRVRNTAKQLAEEVSDQGLRNELLKRIAGP